MINLINLGKKALAVNEANIDITGHNIANINTPGYSRQRLIQEASAPMSDILGNYGSGVEMTRIERTRDQYLDRQYRDANTDLGYWEKSSAKLKELESAVGGPDQNSISTQLNLFFDNWESLANNPNSSIHKSNLVDQTKELVNSFHDLRNSLTNKKKEINDEIVANVGKINKITAELADLNARIKMSENENAPANDLRDRFDYLVDDLSKIANVTVQTKNSDGNTIIYLGSDLIVAYDEARMLSVDSSSDGEIDHSKVIWKDNFEEVNGLNNGELAGLINTRDNTITNYESMLDQLAVKLSEVVNDIHKTGYDAQNPLGNGKNFFKSDVTGAADFNLSDEILYDFNNVSVSESGEVGDNQIALQITDLRSSKAFSDNQSLTEYLGSLLTQIGRDSDKAATNSENLGTTLKQVNNFRESVKGVSLNEESANLIKYQQTYQAAAKIISIADTMFSTIIGLVR